MKRGEVWTVAAGSGYGSKPRPAAILQDNRFDTIESITVCLFTTNPTDAAVFRPPVEPSDLNGLREPSRLMADKIMSLPKTKLGRYLGRLDSQDIARLNRAVMLFLGLAESPFAN